MRTPRLLIALWTSVLALSSASAQMSGTFTINASGSGGRNFKTITSAVSSLRTNGMSGSVVLELATGTFKENVTLVPIKGLSTKNTLTFRPATGANSVWQVASTYRPALSTANSTSTTPISGVVVDGIHFSASPWAIYPLSYTSDWEVRNCRCSSTVGYGIFGSLIRWNVHHNVFEGYEAGVFAKNADGCTISHNDFRLVTSRAISLGTGANVKTLPTRVFNNRITGTLRKSYSAVVLHPGAADVEISHNTIDVSSAYAGSTLMYVTGAYLRANKIRGNLLVASGSASCMQTEGTVFSALSMDENLYFHRSNGPIIVSRRTNPTKYSSLSKWQAASGQDKNSVQGDPKFASISDWQLSHSSPAIGKAKNTPRYVRDDLVGNPRLPNLPWDIGAYEFQNIRVFGKGCPGTGGVVPTMRTVGTMTLASISFLLVEKGRAGAPAVLIVGVSDKKWGAIPLPLRFGGGCNLLVSADLLVPVLVSQTGTQTLAVTIPNDSKLLGSRTFLQWAVGDPAAKGIGLAFSSGLEIDIVK